MKIPKVILRIDTSRACGREILLGISQYCNTLGHWRLSQELPFFINSSNSRDDPSLPENWLADGMVVARPEIPDSVRALGVPVIGIDILNPVEGMPNILGDNAAIAEMARKHFMERGFTHLAYCQFAHIHWADERGARFTASARERGLHVYPYVIQGSEQNLTQEDMLYEIATWLLSLPRPTAVFACNDDCARLIGAACAAEGIHVPDEVAILGVDNDEMVCLPHDPPISSIALGFKKAGFEAAALLDRIMKGREPLTSQEIKLLPEHTVTRRSTDTLAVSDQNVATALRYIREHAHQAMGVPAVVKAAGVSRRALEYSFQSALGRSINSVIQEQRVERVAKLLIQTNLTVSQIAAELEFTDNEHVSRYFRREKGFTPTAFRKKHGALL